MGQEFSQGTRDSWSPGDVCWGRTARTSDASADLAGMTCLGCFGGGALRWLGALLLLCVVSEPLLVHMASSRGLSLSLGLRETWQLEEEAQAQGRR